MDNNESTASDGLRRSLRINHSIGPKNGGMEEFEVNYDDIDVLQWEDDEIALRMAAEKSCLPYQRLTEQEMGIFPELKQNKGSIALYLYLRNKMLQMWHMSPRTELTIPDVMGELPPPYNSDSLLVRRIYEFLQRFGCINVGDFNRLSHSLKIHRKRVIVIGAGIAGIIAAKQLNAFGLDVIVLEARSRIGGRISTYSRPVVGMKNSGKSDVVVELGASFISGANANPMMTLCRQFDISCIPVFFDQMQIYDQTGKEVEPRRMQLVERAFNNMIHAATFVAHTKGITELNGRKLSLGDAINVMLKVQDHRLHLRRLSYFDSYEDILSKLKLVQDTMCIKKDQIMQLYALNEKLKEAECSTDLSDEQQIENEIAMRCAVKDMNDAIEAFATYDSQRKKLNNALAELANFEPSEVYMNEMDKRIFDFHVANLEHSLGASIDDISLKYWNHSEDPEMEGPNMHVAEGLIHFVSSLCHGFDFQVENVVQQIKYDEEKVVVSCLVNGFRNVVYKGDCVLCTVPLGVLKRSVRNRDDAPRFFPELPRWKVDAINSLGFGNINKVILFFKEAFWENTRVFGQIPDTDSSTGRGEVFMFQALVDAPVLIAFVSGESANNFEELPSDFIVRKIMGFLSAVFGPVCPEEPIDVIITRWRSDHFARGAFSYVPPNCTPEAYDVMAMPLNDPAGQKRIFFAGEHTYRQQPATVHGAFLSGLREAGRIADCLLGIPYGPDAGTKVTDPRVSN